MTLKYAVFAVPLKLLFSLLVALLLLRATRLTPIYRAAYYLPSIMGASVAVSVLWKQLFTGDGLINQLLGAEISWLGNTKQIPQELYEAAEVDGAGPLFRFFRITLPLLTSTIFFNLVMQSINGLLVFAQGQIITAGKPMGSTEFYVLYMYQQAFEFNKAGYASALGWVMVLLIALFTVFLFATKKFWVYEGGY